MLYFRLLVATVISLLLFAPYTTEAQLTVNPNQTAAVLAGKLAGPGITISSPTLTCAGVANGTFISVTTPITLDSGIILTSGKSVQTVGPESFLANTSNGTPGDPALAALAGAATFDACSLEFDFVPNGDTVSFNYQFGSEEYINSTCGPYNDAFAFFISGPGITGTQNMALIPGTNIPVTVNSVNNGIPGPGYTLANCTAMGTGSPFTSYYYNNTGGTQVTYKGYTTRLIAFHEVIPCNRYHLKVAICDAGNRLYDSGVFIEAGSLKTNAYWISLFDSIGATILGVPHTIVKGCSPAKIKVKSAHPSGVSKLLRFSYGGTAVRGADFSGPDTATLYAGADSVMINIAGMPTPVTGTKSIRLYVLSPYCGIADSIDITVLDTPSAHIITPDTTICSGASFVLRTTGTPGLSYSWTPTAGLSSFTVPQPLATPTLSATYTMSATIPGAGCPAIARTVNVIVINTAISILTPNTTICAGGSVPITVLAPAGLFYTWSPSTGLTSATIQNPVSSPSATTAYTVTATAAAGMCPSTAFITITVSNLTFNILTPDTAICNGASFTIRVNGPVGPTYTWSPADGISNPALMQPVASPSVTATYSVTSTWPGSGCPDITRRITIKVSDASIHLLTPDTTICYGAQAQIRLLAGTGLLYNWSPAAGLNNPHIQEPIASPTVTTAYSIASTSADGLCTSNAALIVTVGNPGADIVTADTTVCRGGSVSIMVRGDSSLIYHWSPSLGLSDMNTMMPVASPRHKTTYIMTAQIPGTPCTTTGQVTIDVVAVQLSNVSFSTTIPYGSSIQLNADSATYYMWKPDNGSLSNQNINNPIATPLVPTTYTVFGMTRDGCRDSANIFIDLFYSTIFIPDAFTPNGDGLNDVFRVGNPGSYKLTDFRVFNRWGNMVYQASGAENKGWDGTLNNEPQNMDVYNYIIVVTKPDGTLQSFKGNVTLIR